MVPRMGNRAAGCHFRPYSFASSPFDDFADMQNSTRKNCMSTPCRPLPLTGPRPSRTRRPCRIGNKAGGRGLPATPFSRVRTPQAIKEIGASVPAQHRRKGRCIRNPRRQHSAQIPCRIKTIRSAALQQTGTASFRPSLPCSNPPDIPHTSQVLWGGHSASIVRH